MSDWAEITVEKAELKAATLKAYDDSIAAGFERGEILAMLHGMMLGQFGRAAETYFMLAKYWLDTERPA